MLQFDYYRYGNSITIDVVYRTSFDFAILSVMKKILLRSNDFNNMQY